MKSLDSTINHLHTDYVPHVECTSTTLAAKTTTAHSLIVENVFSDVHESTAASFDHALAVSIDEGNISNSGMCSD